MDFSLLSPLEFFVDPKNVDGRNNKPPAMRVRKRLLYKKTTIPYIIGVFKLPKIYWKGDFMANKANSLAHTK